jgi:hypothetical protein
MWKNADSHLDIPDMQRIIELHEYLRVVYLCDRCKQKPRETMPDYQRIFENCVACRTLNQAG